MPIKNFRVREEIQIPEIVIKYLFDDYLSDQEEEFDTYFDEEGEPTSKLKNYKLVESEIFMCDLEEGYILHRVIIKLKDTEKYYQGEYFEYTYYGHEYNLTFKEVFPTTIETTVYV